MNNFIVRGVEFSFGSDEVFYARHNDALFTVEKFSSTPGWVAKSVWCRGTGSTPELAVYALFADHERLIERLQVVTPEVLSYE